MQAYAIVKTLSPNEIRDLRMVLRSEWFNTRADVRKLFELLVKSAMTGASGAPDKKDLFRSLYPDKPYDDRLVRLAGSWLTDVMEAYFKWRRIDDQPVAAHLDLAARYRTRNLPTLFHKQLKHSREALTVLPYRNAEYFSLLHDLYAEEYRFDATTKRTEIQHVQALGDTLNHWFFAQKLRQVCIALSHQTMSNTAYRFDFLPEILTYVEAEGLAAIPAIGLYYHCYRALTQPENDAVFSIFRREIAEHSALFPEEELRDLYVLAINFCTRRVNEGSRVHVREGFELYRTGFERGVFVVNGVLSRFTYRNAAALGLMLHELEWVAGFLVRFCDHLEAPFRESTYSFSLARLEYERGSFDNALVLLRQAESADLLATLSARVLVLKILFETGATDALSSHIDAMRNYIRRHKEIGYHRDNYLNLLKFTQKLMQLPPGDPSAAQRFRAQLEQASQVAEKEWLVGKVELYSP